jgi:hypothetical protein
MNCQRTCDQLGVCQDRWPCCNGCTPSESAAAPERFNRLVALLSHRPVLHIRKRVQRRRSKALEQRVGES